MSRETKKEKESDKIYGAKHTASILWIKLRLF